MNGMKYEMKPDERGAVALLTTIIISILLAIITTGLVTLMISELRQSDDGEQSVRAYYAAQSGVEDGISKVEALLAANSPLISQVCGAPGAQNTNLDPANPGVVGWTCQQISYSGSPQGSLPVPDKAVQVDVGSVTAPPFHSVILEWDTTPRPPAGYPPNFFNAPLGNFPTMLAGWPYAAAIELGVVEYPGTAFSASTAGLINVSNALVVPRTGGGGTIPLASLKGGNPVAGSCNPAAGSYHCQVTITNMNSAPSQHGYVFRLRSRYVGTDYKMTFMTGATGNGSVVPVPDGTATIDITARAGDVYRRVVYKVPISNSAASGLDYVIYADGDVCKDFSTINGAILDHDCPY